MGDEFLSEDQLLLETERLILRPLHMDDAAGLLALYAIPEVTEFTDIPTMQEEGEARRWIEGLNSMRRAGQGLRWGVFDRESGGLIGTCGFHHWDQSRRRAEISYDLSPRWWGQGYMREALQAVLQFGFDRLNLHRIEALVDPRDTRSQNLLYGLGFKLEGVLRDHDLIKGRFQDDMVFALLEGEWKKQV
jgi:ribosomal-protein-alanine N-acetyltransferase